MMTINGQTVDQKTIDRVRKLLNLARDGGATEAEANLAMERAEAILLDNNLTMAMVEASGSSTGEARLKDNVGNANYRWQRELMEAIAKTAFCYMEVKMEKRPIRYGAYRDVAVGYELIGRMSNVTTVRQLYDYLLQTASRLRRDYQKEGHSNREGSTFQEALAVRLTERIKTRHYEALRKQRDEAEAARSSAPTGSNALVVVLADFAASEEDYNNDLRNGWAPGTTKAKRNERDRKHNEARQHQADLIAQGIDATVAWDMAYLGWSREKAEAYEARQSASSSSSSGGGGRFRYRKSREERMEEKRDRKRYTREWEDGTNAGDSVGLDDQVADNHRKAIK